MRLSRGKLLFFSAAAAFVGCDALPGGLLSFISPPPASMTVVAGGIYNTKPYFGTWGIGSDGSLPQGRFLLGSCGCGDWRVLMQPDNGGQQIQFPVTFYCDGPYVDGMPVIAYGTGDGHTAWLELDQAAGQLWGRVLAGWVREYANATRGEAHGGTEVDACIMCHVGDNPLFPLPPTHPQKYKTNPRVCLQCHTANGQ